MKSTTDNDRVFKLTPDIRDPFLRALFTAVEKPVEQLLALNRLNRAYAELAAEDDARPFLDKVLDKLQVSYHLSDDDLSRLLLPRGPVIIVANHPFGGLEGIILGSILRSLRCDVKLLANYLLQRIPDVQDLLIAVDPFDGPQARQVNVGSLRKAIQWVRQGGMLVVFPAGEVSRFEMQTGSVTDPPWQRGVAVIARKTGAPVLPVFFNGANSPLFHVAGIVHPLLRTALLPQELLNKSGMKVEIRVGNLIPAAKLLSLGSDDAVTDYLRLRTYLLQHRTAANGETAPSSAARRERRAEPVISPVDASLMEREIRALPADHVLIENGDLIVCCATADQAPLVLREIGRLREITFRAAGEGTGRAVDLDRFDTYYTHLFLWDRANRAIAGAYRLGKTDEILTRFGVQGLYTSTLFTYQRGMPEGLGPALEMGRSFVRQEYQKSYAPLLLLWKGIGRFVTDHPQYRTLFGPVSISDDYSALSRRLLMAFLTANRYRPDLAALVRPRNPVSGRARTDWIDRQALKLVRDDVEAVSDLISDIEGSGSGVPILLKHYLRLGGRIIGFNRDPDFGNVLDSLIVVDLTATDPRLLERYLGKEGAAAFLAYHAPQCTAASGGTR